MLRKLDGEARNTARAALDQDRLAGFQLQRVLDRTQGRETGEGEGGRVNMRQGGRFLCDNGTADGDLFGIGPIAARFQHAKHFVADSQIPDAGAHRADHAGEIAPQDHGKARLGVFAGAHLPVGAVDACGKGIDDDLARPGRWIGKIAVLQDLRSAKLLDVSSLHGVLTFATRVGKRWRRRDHSRMLPDSLLFASGRYDRVFATRHLSAGRGALEFEAAIELGHT